MAKKKKHQKKSSSSSSMSLHKKTTKNETLSTSWVDRLIFEPIVHDDDDDDSDPLNNNNNDNNKKATTTTIARVRIISWNVLAEAYLTRRSHRNLPHANVVFAKKRRRALLERRLTQLSSLDLDFICLQEVDLWKETSLALETEDFHGIATPTDQCGGSIGGRMDSCAIFYRKSKWKLKEKQIIKLDDLATMNDDEQESSEEKEKECYWQGLQQSFLRHNVALICKFQSKSIVPHEMIVVNLHLYWNPKYDYVKLCQIHYILLKAKEMMDDNNRKRCSIVVCGDFNSRPGNPTHTYLSHGSINAKRVAPWCPDMNDDDDENVPLNSEEGPTMESLTKMVEHWQWKGNPDATTTTTNDYDDTKASETTTTTPAPVSTSTTTDTTTTTTASDTTASPASTTSSTTTTTTTPRYICDYTLNRFTRWLRILGLDCELETEEEERQRTKFGNLVLLTRAQQQKDRTLLTTSSKLVQRKECPPGTFFINTNRKKITTTTTTPLEDALIHLLRSQNVSLYPKNFLTRCVVCNGNIKRIPSNDLETKRQIFKQNGAPISLVHEIDSVYQCNGSNCLQGYWWCDQPTSSASRVKQQATHLYQLCIRGGVNIVGDNDNNHMFTHVNIKHEKEIGIKQGLLKEYQSRMLRVLKWLGQEELSCPFTLESSYADKVVVNVENDGIESSNGSSNKKKKKKRIILGESIPFTNVTSDFVDCLDYIFFEKNKNVKPIKRLYVPKSFRELNSTSSVVPNKNSKDEQEEEEETLCPQQEPLLNGHLLPSNVWPSDHLAIGVELEYTFENDHVVATETTTATNESSNPLSNQQDAALYCGTNAPPPLILPKQRRRHAPKCDCGCVPTNTLSLFEMAELRKQYRLKRQEEKKKEMMMTNVGLQKPD